MKSCALRNGIISLFLSLNPNSYTSTITPFRKLIFINKSPVPSLTSSFSQKFRLFSSSMAQSGDSSSSSSVEKQFEGFRSQLDDSGKLKERIKSVASEMETATRFMHSGLLLVHQSRPIPEVIERANVQIEVLKGLYSKLADILKECPGQYYRFHGEWRSETQTAVSLIVLMHWLETGDLLMHKETEAKLGLGSSEFGLDIEDYLTGLGAEVLEGEGDKVGVLTGRGIEAMLEKVVQREGPKLSSGIGKKKKCLVMEIVMLLLVSLALTTMRMMHKMERNTMSSNNHIEEEMGHMDMITNLALKDLYTHLTPIQRVNIARHPNRPTFLDHVINITEKWVELHGDRAGYDDPAIVTGLGTIDGQRYMFIGQQKGRNTKENIQRNFGMPTPHGYRKALRMMYYADHHGFPIVTFIDTPGAYADLKSEELGQGEAIAFNLRTMFGLKVPIVSIVIGEGGSGGALAIGCANKLLMMENAVFYVASPEACAAILWKSAKAAPKAAEKLKITAPELCQLGICDGIIPEPLGGAHADSAWTSQQIKIAVTEAMAELKKKNIPELLNHRMLKFRSLGGFQEGLPVEPEKKVNMKQKEEPIVQSEDISKTSDIELEGEVEKLREQIMKARESSTELPKLGMDEIIEKLKKEVDQEYAEAAKAMGLTDSLNKLRDEFLKSRKSSEQAMDPSLVEKIEKLKADFNLGLSEAPNYASLTYKLDMLKEISKDKKLSEQTEKAMTLKQDINKRFKEVMNRADVKKKIEALEAEIASARGSTDEALAKALEEKIVKVKKEVEFELADVLKSLRLDVDIVKSKTKAFSEQIRVPELKYRIVELNEDINEGIEEAISSTDLKNKMELLKLEMVKAGKTPDVETTKKIDTLKQQIKQKLAEVLTSSTLVEKHAKLKEEIAQDGENSGESDESILNEDLRYGDSGVGIGAGCTYG